MMTGSIAAHAGMIGLLIFFSFFTCLLFWIFRPGSKEGYIAKANIPLNEDGTHD